MTHSTPAATLTVRSRLTSFAIFAALMASLFTFPAPTLAHHVNASDFFIFSKAVYGKALEAEGGVVGCDGTGNQDLTASVSGSDNEFFGRIHSNADWNGGGQNNLFHNAVTYGTHDEDCSSVPGDNDYSPPPPNDGAPTEVDAAPVGVGVGGWPGTLGSSLNADALTFTTSPAACDVGDLTLSSDYTINPVTDNNKVICRGTGKVQLNIQNATMKVTIISHGLIEISGQNANLSPADNGHGILAWTDQDSNTQEFSAKVAGSNFHIGPSIIFTPRSGQDISGSQGSELCIQHIGQGQIKVQGSDNEFGPGACGDRNPSCADLGDYDHEFKIESTNDGTYDDPNSDFVVTLDFRSTASGEVVDFSANLPVDAVFVKGGTDGTEYTYDPPVTSATDLHAPVNPNNNTYHDVSHISFCFDEVPRLVPNVSVAKTPDGATVNAGGTATFSILVTNHGPGASTVTLADTLPSGFVWTEASDSHNACSVSGLSLTCNFGSIPDTAGSNTRTVSVSAPTDSSKCGTINNTATITPSPDTNANDNSDSGSIIVACPNVSVVKTPDGTSLTAGDTATFLMTVTNNGPGAASNVGLSDSLPNGGLSWTEASDSHDKCTVSGPVGTQVLSCAFGTLAQGDVRTVSVSSPVDTDDCGLNTNTVTITATGDINSVDNTDNGSVTVLCPIIRVEKTPDEGQDLSANDIQVGADAVFTITVYNDGDGTANGVTLFDDLPEVTNGWDVVGALTTLTGCSVTDPEVGEHAAKGEILTCGPDTILALGSKKVTVKTATTNAECGAIDNIDATARATNDGEDKDSGNIDVLCPNLSIQKTTSTPVVNAGDGVSYTVSLPNNGTGTATGVVVTDNLPSGILWAETSADCSIDSGALTCGPVDILAGQTFSVTLTGTTDAGECPSISNSASFTSTNAGSGSTASVPTVIQVDCPDLVVEKGGSSVVVAGDQVQFTLKVSNIGDGDAYAVVLEDNLPALGSGTWAITAVDGIAIDDCDIDADVLTCTLEVLAADEDFTVTLTATSDSDDCPSLTNDATVEASNEPTDQLTQSDNADTHTIQVHCPDTSIEKEATTPVVNAGDEATFTITVTAGGTGTNKNVTLTDNLIGDDDDWSFVVSGDGSDEDCSISESEVLLCEFGDLDPLDDDEVTIVLTYQTDSDDCPSIANTASVSATVDTNASNNESDEVEITVNCPDVTVVKTPVDSPISAGEQGQFTLKVTNNGPGTAYDVEVIDNPQAGTVWTVLNNGGFACTSTVGGGQQAISCKLAELAAEADATILIGYLTIPADCPEIDNAVTVTASNEPEADTDDNDDEASIVVQCPGLNVLKEDNGDPIDAGEQASFTITVWNTGPGDALNVELHDDLPTGLTWDFEVVSGPADEEDCSLEATAPQSLDCQFGTVEPTDLEDEEDDEIVIRVFATTDRTDCGLLTNTAEVDASNLLQILRELGLEQPSGNVLEDSADITVRCTTIALEKENDAVGSVLPGTTVTYTLTLTVDDGPAENVVVVDDLPVGLENPTTISNGGVFAAGAITWTLGNLADGEYELTYQAKVAGGVANGATLVNAAEATSTNSQCPNAATLGPECEDTSTVIVRVPTLVIDKVANADVIEISGPASAPVATPSVVTWTLTYTLANGPVTNAVITDTVPAGVVYVAGSASNGGVFNDATDTLTWTFPTLSASGSVTFQTTVDAATISLVAPTVNVTTIDSTETAPDSGQDSIRAVRESELGGNPTPTPRPSLPNTAAGTGVNGEPVTVPIELLVAFFLGSLGALAYANVRSSRRR